MAKIVVRNCASLAQTSKLAAFSDEPPLVVKHATSQNHPKSVTTRQNKAKPPNIIQNHPKPATTPITNQHQLQPLKTTPNQPNPPANT